MRVGYLTGERIYLRPLEEADQETATAWFDSPFPINGTRAKTFLDEQPVHWWDQSDHTLVIARVEDDSPIGGLNLWSENRRIVVLRFHMAPVLDDVDALRAEAVRIVVPWLRDEHEYMVVELYTADDEPETVAAAEGVGMKLAYRLREFLARPGGRVDELSYVATNPRWEVRDA